MWPLFRRKRATERKGLSPVDVAVAGGSCQPVVSAEVGPEEGNSQQEEGALGFPILDADPTVVCGASASGFRETRYFPPPPGLAELIYSTRLMGETREVAISAECGPLNPLESRRMEMKER